MWITWVKLSTFALKIRDFGCVDRMWITFFVRWKCGNVDNFVCCFVQNGDCFGGIFRTNIKHSPLFATFRLIKKYD